MQISEKFGTFYPALRTLASEEGILFRSVAPPATD